MSHTTDNIHDRDGDLDHHHHRRSSFSSAIDHLTHDAYFGKEIDFVVGLTATALTADQVLKMRSSKHHKAAHLAKAGLGAVAATTAFTMMAREHEAEKKHKEEMKLRKAREQQERGRRRMELLERGYVETIADSDTSTDGESDDRRLALGRPWGRSEYGGYRRRGSTYERSRSSSRSPPPVRRAVSQSPVRTRSERRSESHPRLKKFFEVVKDSLEEEYRRRQEHT